MEIDLSYDVLGARIRQIGPFEVHYAGLLKQAHQVGPLALVYHRKQLVKIGPADMEFDWKGGRLRRLGEWELDYDWLGTRLRSIGPYAVSYDWAGSRVRDVGPMRLGYSRGGQIPETVLVPDEETLSEERLIILYH